jgi:hypothetical protein
MDGWMDGWGHWEVDFAVIIIYMSWPPCVLAFTPLSRSRPVSRPWYLVGDVRRDMTLGEKSEAHHGHVSSSLSLSHPLQSTRAIYNPQANPTPKRHACTKPSRPALPLRRPLSDPRARAQPQSQPRRTRTRPFSAPQNPPPWRRVSPSPARRASAPSAGTGRGRRRLCPGSAWRGLSRWRWRWTRGRAGAAGRARAA